MSDTRRPDNATGVAPMHPHAEAVPMQHSQLVMRWLARVPSMPSPMAPRYRALICVPSEPRFEALRIAAGDQAIHASNDHELERMRRKLDVATIVVVADLDRSLGAPALSSICTRMVAGSARALLRRRRAASVSWQ